MSDGLVTLRMLGAVELSGPDGRPLRSVLAQPSRLALLLYLASTDSGQFHRKDTVRALFWPEADGPHARQALNRAIYVLRQALGPDVLETRGDDEVRVATDRLQCDVIQFERALQGGALETALDLYRSDLAPGFFVSGLPEFERWLESERVRLRERAVGAAGRLADVEEAGGRIAAAVRWAKRAADLSPYDERAAARHIGLLDRSGDRASALRAFEELRRRLREDLEVDPSPETAALVEAVRARRPVPRTPPSAVTDTPTVAPPAPDGRARPRARVLIGAAVVVLVGAGSIVLLRPRTWAVTTSNAVPVTSDPGIEFQPALSPDGHLVAFTTVQPGRTRISVRSTTVAPDGGEVRLQDSPGENAMLPSWSPDGELVRYVTTPNPAPQPAPVSLRQVSRLGGASRALELARRTQWVAWSRDGTRAAFATGDSIFTSGPGDSRPRLLARHPGPWRPHSLAWSPDGRWIAYVYGNHIWVNGWNSAPSTVWLVDTQRGTRLAVTDETHLNVSPAWLDATHLLFVSDRDGQREVYGIEVGPNGPRGAPVEVPGGGDAHSISLSHDGRRLALAKFVGRQNVWSFPLVGARPATPADGRPVTSGTQVVETHGLSPDGRWLAYDATLRGEARLYKVRLDSGAPIPLVGGMTVTSAPSWSPDGREIAFYAGKTVDIWVASADGSGATRLTSDPGFEEIPIWAPDGLSITYRSYQTGHLEAWIVTRERVGGPWSRPRQLTTFGCHFQVWMRDGSLLCARADETVLTQVSPTGAVLGQRDLATSGLSAIGPPALSPDGAMLYLRATRGGRRGIWAVPWAGGPARLAVSIDDPSRVVLTYPGTINVGRDRLYVTVAEFESDIWVMDIARQ